MSAPDRGPARGGASEVESSAVSDMKELPASRDVATSVRIIALLTCFNRKALTLACLRSLSVAAARAGVELGVIVVDDASTDGTAQAIRDEFPFVDVVDSSGNLYWTRGMHTGFERALRQPCDYYLWLNDDTHLVPDALRGLLEQMASLRRREGQSVILIGATAERSTGRITYGGRVASTRLKPFNYRLVWSEREPVPCAAMEGNCVLIPAPIATQLGNLDPAFEHAMGDTDYGLRALSAGYKLYVAAGVAGYCSTNALQGSYFDASLPLRRRWKLILDRKGLPVRSWLHFSRRHGGILWPLHFSWPYVKLVLTSLLRRPRRRAV